MRQTYRSDRGVPWITDRDIFIMQWIASQYAVRFDVVHRLMEHYNQVHGDAEYGQLTEHAVKKAIRRWGQKADWVETRKIMAGQPQWVYLSKHGLAEFGLDYPYYSPSLSKTPHIHAATIVRLYVESRHGSNIQWRSERQLRQAQGGKVAGHLADGEVTFKGTRIAIEVELTRKQPERLQEILQQLRSTYGVAWYFVSADCAETVREAMTHIPHHTDIFRVYELSSIFRQLWPTTPI